MFLGLDTNRLPGPPGALDAAMVAGTTHIYVPTAYDGYVRPGCGDANQSIYRVRNKPPSDADCARAGSASWRTSCGRFDNSSSLQFGPQRVFDEHGLAPTWAGDGIGWTCGSFVRSVWQDGWSIPYPGDASAASKHNTVELFTGRGLKIMRNVETPFDAIKASARERPDLGATLLAWKATGSHGVSAMDPTIQAFRDQLAAPTDGLWYDEEWVVANQTRFPLTTADRKVAQLFVAQGCELLHMP